MKTNHHKHTALIKSDLGNFAKNEIAILGTPCSQIKDLAYKLIKLLSPNLKIAYVDADHKNQALEDLGTNNSLISGATMEYTDKISFKRFDFRSEINEYYIKNFFSDNDLVIVNGNHFKAKKQILVIDPNKPLQKKLDKITEAIAIIFTSNTQDIPDYLISHLPNYSKIPKFLWQNITELAHFMQNVVTQEIPEIKGLVLAGGKSIRMQRDKALLKYHGKTQLLHTLELLQPFCKEVFISTQKDQRSDISSEIKIIEDTFINLGPFGAILSAFREDPNSAWLVVACDLPYLDHATLNLLVLERNPFKMATAFINPQNDFPEPLITIWEPGSYKKLLYFLSMGYSCPRKVLINSEIELLELTNPKAIRNINYPEEYEATLEDLTKAAQGKNI
jgi:molybdenum cofactor guanylyltransferase